MPSDHTSGAIATIQRLRDRTLAKEPGAERDAYETDLVALAKHLANDGYTLPRQWSELSAA